MFWSIVNFGKHQGKTLPQIMFTDPDWFFYMMGTGSEPVSGDASGLSSVERELGIDLSAITEEIRRIFQEHKGRGGGGK